MIPGRQETQPPLDGGEGSTVQERWELVLLIPSFETRAHPKNFPKGLCHLQDIFSGACEGGHRHTWPDGGTGRVVCQNSQVCLGEDIQHGRDVPTGHHRAKTRSDQRF